MVQMVATGHVSAPIPEPAHERVAAFTSLFVARSGTVVCGFQLGSAKHAVDCTLRLCHSTDGGSTWSVLIPRLPTVIDGIPGSLAGAEIVEPIPGTWLLFSTWFDRSDPDRPLFNPETEGLLKSRQVVSVSTDAGRTWSPWRTIPTPGLSGCAATGPALRGPGGEVGFAFESFKEFDDPAPARHGAWLTVSRDGGKSFPELHLVAQDSAHQVYYWDQRLCPGAEPGSYVALFWTHDRQTQRDLPVHIVQGQLGQPAWQTPLSTGVIGQIAAPLVLPDGRLLMFVVDRNSPATMSLWVSPDQGRTWPPSERVVVYAHDEQARLTQGAENVDFAEYWEDMRRWTFGHPALRLLPDGHVLAVWYAGVPGSMGIRWARLHP